jgi:predicted dinucleotide-binding enzyme
MSAETGIGTVGIIGAGHIGQAFARTALRAGRTVVIANSRGRQSLAPVVAALGGRTSSEIVAELVEGARVVKAANTVSAELLGADPHDAGGRRVLFLSGDDGAAKTEVAELFEAAGFTPVDLGDLATGARVQAMGGPLAGHNLVQLP